MDLYFRGIRNLDAALADLERAHGLTDATHVIVSGDSAGGLATYWHADRYQARLPKASVVAAPDSGFFFDYADYPKWSQGLGWVVDYMNATSGLDASCVAAQRAAGADPLNCRWPGVVVPHISVPLFVLNSRFDPALDSIVAGVSSGDASSVNAVGAALLDIVNRTVLAPGVRDAAFIDSCHQHCGQWAQGQVPTPASQAPADANVTIDGYTAVAALSEWYAAIVAGETPRRRAWVQQAGYPSTRAAPAGSAEHAPSAATRWPPRP